VLSRGSLSALLQLSLQLRLHHPFLSGRALVGISTGLAYFA